MEDKWPLVEKLVDELYNALVHRVSERKVDRSNVFYIALVGRASVQSRIERTLVTLLGEYAPRIFMLFFSSTRELPPPFDFQGELRGTTLQVKVVSGEHAFNSSVRNRVARESAKYSNPVILTLQGHYFTPVRVGKAMWLSAPSSWRAVTGDAEAYKTFTSVVFRVAKKYRDVVWREMLETPQLYFRVRGCKMAT